MNLTELPAAVRTENADSRLMLVTATFPFGPGESFLAAELEHLASLMGEVEIVPSFRQAGEVRPTGSARVNLSYSQRRWGVLRRFHVLAATMGGLLDFDWLGELKYILRHPHRVENMVELARALYRARMFSSFLHRRYKAGKMPDVVYFYWMVPEIMGAIAMRKKTGSRFSIVARAHRTDLYAFTRRGKYFGLRSAIAAGIDAVYCVSAHGQEYLAQAFPALDAKCHLARLGVPEPGFLNTQPGPGALSIVSCSFVSEVKRVELLVDAMASLAEMMPDLLVSWTHIGDGPLLERVKTRAHEMLDNRVEFAFTGHLDNLQILEMYRRHRFDVFVNVSKSEGLPVTLMEAASVGLPLIATDVGGSREIVGAENGILLPPDPDPLAVALAIRKFADKSWASELRTRSRACWEARFDAETNHRRFAQALLERKGQVRQ